MEFAEWLIQEETLRSEVEKMLQRVADPVLKAELEKLLDSDDDQQHTPIVKTALPPTFTPGAAKKEPFHGIVTALKQKERTSGLPLCNMFGAMLAGRGNDFERARFGRINADAGKKIIVGVIEAQAKAADNWELLQLLHKYKDSNGAQQKVQA